MQASLEDKQKFLRSEILDSGVDPQSFMVFMGTVKDQGENINIENWTIAQLKQVVQQFKKSIQEEIKLAKKQINESRASKEVVTNKIMASLMKKDKVFYDRDDLWDYQILTQQECRKIQKVFEFKSDPQIDYKSWEIKKTGGYIFGLGSKNQLQITFITNFTSYAVIRKSQDVDWLRSTLCSKYPGSFVPPLEQTRPIQSEDKVGIMRRIKQIILFLNSVVNFENLVQNKYFYSFIAEKDIKSFMNFKSKQTAARTTIDISSIENLQGKFSVQISKRVLNFIKDTADYGRTSDQIYFGMQANLKKILGDFEALTKHSHSVANDFAKLNDKFNKLSQKCQFPNSSTGEKTGNIFAYLNNMFTNMGNQYKKQMNLIRQITDDFVRYTHAEWSEFLLHEKKFNHEMNNYLTTKLNLLKKKQRNFSDISKWELDDREMFRMSRVNTAKMDKEQAFQIMYPRDNRAEEEMRIWQAYINDMYEKTFKILINEQEKQYLKYFGRFCTKMQKLSEQQREMYQRFKQIFGITGRTQVKQTMELKQ